MSQLDKVNFLPHIFWFIILFGIFYFIVYSYVLPLIFQSLQTRSLLFNSFLKDTFSFKMFYYYISHISKFFLPLQFLSTSFGVLVFGASAGMLFKGSRLMMVQE